MSTLDDSVLSLAGPGPEGAVAPTSPAQPSNGFLLSSHKRAIGNASYRLDPSNVVAMPGIPAGSQSAILVLEAAPGAAAGKPLGRFWADGTWPTTISGLPAYDGAVIEIIGQDDLYNFRMISVDGLTHKINIQYYSGR